MRILLVSGGSGSRGGGEIFLKYLAAALTKRGHDVALWIPDHPRMDELAAKCAPVARVVRGDYRNTYDRPFRSLPTVREAQTALRLSREWAELQPDVIHVNKQNLEDGLDLLRAADVSEVPSVATIHITQSARYLEARIGWLRDRIARNSIGRYRGLLVAVQEGRRSALEQFIGGAARTRTVLYGVPQPSREGVLDIRKRTRERLGLKEDEFLVLGVGRLVEQKRPLAFLNAAGAIHRVLPETRFVWVGEGNLREEWNDQIRARALENVVSCVGWQDDVRAFLLAGDLLLHVAKYEGFPLALIEAMASGLACAVTRDLASEISLFDETNVLFADDLDALTAEIRSRDRLAGIATAARCLAKRHLSEDAMAVAYEAVYADAIAIAENEKLPVQ